jgi:phosphoribosylformylglycinamidine synthase
MLLSESQERMLIVGHRKHRAKILNVFKKWDLEAHVIGTVTSDGKYTIVYDTPLKKNVVLPMEFSEIFPDVREDWDLTHWKAQRTKHEKAARRVTQEIWRQYDWMVGVRTLKGPNKPGRYAVLDAPEIGKQIIIAWSSDEGLSDRSPTRGIEHAFDTCLNRLCSLGATPLGITNCLNFGHPKDSMGAFSETVDALTKRCKNRKIPVVSGNVSLYNAYKTHSIKPTPVLVMAGVKQL